MTAEGANEGVNEGPSLVLMPHSEGLCFGCASADHHTNTIYLQGFDAASSGWVAVSNGQALTMTSEDQVQGRSWDAIRVHANIDFNTFVPVTAASAPAQSY